MRATYTPHPTLFDGSTFH